MDTVLVTGGAGFIGSHVVDALLEAGSRVVVLDDLSGGFADNVADGAELVEGTIIDAALLGDLFARHRFRRVYHLAAYAAEGLSHFIRRFNYENNLVGSVNLINEAVNHDVECFVFTSSIAVYGAQPVPMTEDMTPRPEDPYGIAKFAVEQELKAAHEMFGLDYVVFRPHNVYGTRQNIGDRYRNVIGIFMNQIMQGEPMTVFGDGAQVRAFSHVSAVAPAIARSPDVSGARGEVFNVGADEPYSVLTLAREVAAAMGVEPNVRHLDARMEVVNAYCSHEKARAVFGDPPAVSLSDGLAEMAEWARRAGPRSSAAFGALEIERELPPSWRSAT